MPPDIEIPDSLVPGFIALAGLSKPCRQELRDQLRARHPTLVIDVLCNDLGESIQPLGDQASHVVDVLLSFHRTIARLSLPPDDLAAAVISAARSAEILTTPPEDGWESLQDDVALLLDATSSLHSTARALELMAEQGNPLYACRTLTDFRPIFAEDPAVKPSVGVILHTLRLQYFRDDESVGDLYLALGYGDLMELRDALDRAIAKGDTLRRTLEEFGVTIVQESHETR